MELDILIKPSIKVRGLIAGNKLNLYNLRSYPSIFLHNVDFLQSNVVLLFEGYSWTKFHIWAKHTGKFLSFYLWEEWGKSPTEVEQLAFFGLNRCSFSLFRLRLTSHRPDWQEQMFLVFQKVPQLLNLSCKLQLTGLCTLLIFLTRFRQRRTTTWELPLPCVFIKDPFNVLYFSKSLPLCCSCCTSSWKREARDHLSF